MIGILGPILGVAAKAGLAAVSGKGKGGVISAALDGAGDFFEASANETAKKYELAIEETRAERDILKESNETARKQLEHRSLFVAGARPAMQWVVTAAMAYHFIIHPICSGAVLHYLEFEMYDAEWMELFAAVTAALGIGGLRSYEKMKGVASNSMKG